MPFNLGTLINYQALLVGNLLVSRCATLSFGWCEIRFIYELLFAIKTAG